MTTESNTEYRMGFILSNLPPEIALSPEKNEQFSKEIISQILDAHDIEHDPGLFIVGKICDFCGRNLPRYHPTQLCEICSGAYDTCKNCENKRRENNTYKVCYRDCNDTLNDTQIKITATAQNMDPRQTNSNG